MEHYAANRSMPSTTVIPVLGYEDVREATAWLCDVFGFRERLRIAEHRAQLVFGDGAVVVAGQPGGGGTTVTGQLIMVRVADVDQHHARARDRGARILQAPTDQPYGERQYVVEDLGGHCWMFSQAIADVDPASWGGELLATAST